MRSIEDIRSTLASKEQRSRVTWFKQEVKQEGFKSFDYSLRAPTQKEASRSLNALDRWIIQWRNVDICGVEVIWKSVYWSWLGGERSIPQRIRFLTPEGVYTFLNLLHQWKRAIKRIELARSSQFAEGLLSLAQERHLLWESTDEEFDRYLNICRWLFDHYPADCYIREIPVEGVDTKWLERRRSAVARVVCAKRGIPYNLVDFFKSCGFKELPQTVRVLHGQIFVTGLPSDEMVQLTPNTLNQGEPKAVVIVENIQTGLSIDVPSSIPVLMGLGFALDVLSKIRWLQRVPLYYFGDLDVHGLLILSNLRQLFPQTQSFLMSESTLIKWKHLSVKDPTERLTISPSQLTESEMHLFKILQKDYLRLEQERIPLSEINEVLQGIFQR